MKRKSKGTALIAALLILAIIATLSTLMASMLQRSYRQTQIIFNETKAFYFAKGVKYWAKSHLLNKANLHLPQKFEIKHYHHANIIGTLSKPDKQHPGYYLSKAMVKIDNYDTITYTFRIKI